MRMVWETLCPVPSLFQLISARCGVNTFFLVTKTPVVGNGYLGRSSVGSSFLTPRMQNDTHVKNFFRRSPAGKDTCVPSKAVSQWASSGPKSLSVSDSSSVSTAVRQRVGSFSLLSPTRRLAKG